MDEQQYWFRAKRYGLGWGLPITWQGWTVLGLWFAALILGRRYLIPQNMFAHLLFALGMLLLLFIICYMKGAPPGWRFGNRP